MFVTSRIFGLFPLLMHRNEGKTISELKRLELVFNKRTKFYEILTK